MTCIVRAELGLDVFNLRKKIEPEPASPRFLVGVRGLGYRFEDGE